MQEGTSEGTGTDGGGASGKYEDNVVAACYGERARGDGRLAYRTLPRTKAATVADILVALAEEEDVDFLVVGVDGLGRFVSGMKDHLGSTSDAVVRKARCNVIVVQNPGGGTFRDE